MVEFVKNMKKRRKCTKFLAPSLRWTCSLTNVPPSRNKYVIEWKSPGREPRLNEKCKTCANTPAWETCKTRGKKTLEHYREAEMKAWTNEMIQHIKKLIHTGCCSSVNRAPDCELKGHQFNSQSGHRPGLQARSPVGGAWEATTHWCFSPSLSPSLLFSLKIKK